MSEERKPLWPWIVAFLIGLPVLYVLSVGPAAWICDSIPRPHPQWLQTALNVFYWPLGWIDENGPSFIHDALDLYVQLFH